ERLAARLQVQRLGFAVHDIEEELALSRPENIAAWVRRLDATICGGKNSVEPGLYARSPDPGLICDHPRSIVEEIADAIGDSAHDALYTGRRDDRDLDFRRQRR